MTSARRRHPRAPLEIEISYRTAGAFLVAYSVNLSKGGVFIEAAPLPVGTPVRLALDVPGTGRLEVDGVVVWQREPSSANLEGLPGGMGVRFEGDVEARLGAAIDGLVSRFEGLEVLLWGAPERRRLLGRYLASILACDAVEPETLELAGQLLRESIDLVILDLPAGDRESRELLRMALAADSPPPLVALCPDEMTARWALAQGVAQVLREPPTLTALQRAVVGALGRTTAR